jgi:hypothetical protein
MHRVDPSWSKPGTVAPRSAVYRVYHYQHRAPHEVFIPRGTVLPNCKHCAHLVQFAPLITAEPMEDDRDLAVSKGTAA